MDPETALESSLIRRHCSTRYFPMIAVIASIALIIELALTPYVDSGVGRLWDSATISVDSTAVSLSDVESYINANGASMSDIPSAKKNCGGKRFFNNTRAVYCPATPDTVYINGNATDFEKNVNNGAIMDTVKHELAHRAIYFKTGSTDPFDDGGEAVASSYAVLYLGASRASLDSNRPHEYLMSPLSDLKAVIIHSKLGNVLW